MYEHSIVALAGIGILAIACQWIAWWVKLPAILFLLLAGVVAGPVLGWLQPEALFGDLLFPIVSLSVAVILFEGSLTLRLQELVGLERVVRRLVTTGILVTWAVTTLATRWLLGFDWSLCLLFGAVTVVTGPTVIVPMLRTVRPTVRVANALRWEGIVIDPIGALLAVLVFEFIVSGQVSTAFGHTLLTFGKVLAAGLILGAAGGYALGIALRRHWLPEFLHNVATLTLVFGVFAAANSAQTESGLLAVTVMGLWLGNMRGVPVDDILDFKESLSVLLISGLFIVLAARIDFGDLQQLGWPALGVFLAIQFLARPLKVLVATWGSSLNWRERTLLAWIAPRGIVAAAVIAIFAVRLQQRGYTDAPLLVPLTFMVIIGTVVLQSATARLIAVWLKVAEPEPKGFLVIGASPLAQAIAQALEDKGFRTLLTDTNWDHIRAARMAGLSTYYGNAVSEQADRHLDLVGIGRLLAMSPRAEVNALAANRYRGEFGANHLYVLPTTTEQADADKPRRRAPIPGQVLFGGDVSYKKLSSLISQGAEIHETLLTDTFDYDDYYKKYYKRANVLFAVGPRGSLHVFVDNDKFKPGEGSTVIALIQPEAKPETEADTEQPSPTPA
jgi:NhaP-type Na+/H+ or K+/H+ antiporter